MKKILLLILTLSTTVVATSQDNTKDVIQQKEPGDEEHVFERIEINAQFPGGEKKMTAYVEGKFDWTLFSEIKDTRFTDSVFVNFIVSKKGKITSIKTAGNASPLLRAAVIKLLSESPDWEPSNACGRNVNAYRYLKFTINISPEYQTVIFRNAEPGDFPTGFNWQ